MKGCLNILWHIPFLGFIFAAIYAIFGVILCCTIILLPMGLGFFQIALFLLSPFSSALVSKSDLRLIRPLEEKTSMKVWSTAVMIIYLPLGIIGAIGTLSLAVSCCLSIVGIPVGIVYFKLLPSIFNPIGKVCVPAAVAQEIELIKSGDVVNKYKGAYSSVPQESSIA